MYEKTNQELLLIPKYEKYMEYMLEIILIKLPRTEKYSIGTEYKTIMYQTFKEIMFIEKLLKCSASNNSFTFVEVVAFIPRLACGRPLPIRLKGERTKQPHGQFASAQAYHIGSSLSSDVSTINNKPLLVLYWRQPIKSRLGAHGIVIRFDI